MKTKNRLLCFNPDTHLLAGPSGSLSLDPNDRQAHRFLMLVEGQCLHEDITSLAAKYGYCRQRYYQILHSFQQGGLKALQPQKTGPKTSYRRTDQAVRQVLRHLFLDPQASPEVITQKLRQTHFAISLRSVQRIIADYGLQKKTLYPQSQETTPATAHPARRQARSARTGRRPQRRTRGPAAPGA